MSFDYNKPMELDNGVRVTLQNPPSESYPNWIDVKLVDPVKDTHPLFEGLERKRARSFLAKTGEHVFKEEYFLRNVQEKSMIDPTKPLRLKDKEDHRTVHLICVDEDGNIVVSINDAYDKWTIFDRLTGKFVRGENNKGTALVIENKPSKPFTRSEITDMGTTLAVTYVDDKPISVELR